MSYASGFMLGAAIGKAIHNFVCADADRPAPGRRRPTAASQTAAALERVSVLPGRRRYRAAAVIQNQLLADMLCQGLSRLPGIQTIAVNTLTGSILICAADEAMLDKVEYFLSTRIFLPLPQPADRTATPVSAYADALFDTFDLFSRFISSKTGNVLDLRSLLSLFLVIRGMRKMISLNQRPSGPQMLWWAASLMRGRR